MSLQLNCLIYPDANPADHCFPVEIESDKILGYLKTVLKAGKKHTLSHVDAKDLILWQLESTICIDGNLRANLQALKLDGSCTGVKKLGYAEKMRDIFPNAVARNHLQILVQVPRMGEGYLRPSSDLHLVDFILYLTPKHTSQ